MAFGPASRLGVSRFDETAPVEWVPGLSATELDTIIQAVYRQVLGNAYVMESERLATPESQFKQGDLSVREFVRRVGKSDLYRSRFFEGCPRYRYTELNFRHFLGRAPSGYGEMKQHSDILDSEGFEADIDSYVDSDEYQNNFGEDLVPYIRGYKSEAAPTMVGFTHTFELVRGASSSSLKGSVTGNKPRLNSYVINAVPTPVVPPSGASSGWSFQEPARDARVRQGYGATANGKVYRIEVTGYRAKTVRTTSKFRRSNQVFLVPYDRLSQEYQRIHKQGGVIASITPVS
ncbi:MAG: photosystem I reaction center subunit XII [Leptolyngbya sp. SIO4C1]|nr:photosystem I reaction center subunit XII [Leptolyngbya sp. SIO4C1]